MMIVPPTGTAIAWANLDVLSMFRSFEQGCRFGLNNFHRVTLAVGLAPEKRPYLLFADAVETQRFM